MLIFFIIASFIIINNFQFNNCTESSDDWEETFQCLDQYVNGEMSGNQCSELLVDYFGNTFGGFAGEAAAFGSAFGPIGAIFGGVAASIFGSSAAQAHPNLKKEWIFSSRKDNALKKAYRYFNLNEGASNTEIDTVYRQMCMKHHPDRGGKAEDFHDVQVNMAIIKAARRNF